MVVALLADGLSVSVFPVMETLPVCVELKVNELIEKLAPSVVALALPVAVAEEKTMSLPVAGILPGLQLPALFQAPPVVAFQVAVAAWPDEERTAPNNSDKKRRNEMFTYVD